jgi:plastocyanin
MKKIFTLIIGLLVFLNSNAQNSHTINTAGNSFSPSNLTINVGDTVIWNNTGGYHNINAILATYPSNPEGFGNGVAAAPWSFQWVFTMPGTYDYQCDTHVGLGMIGVIVVNNSQSSVCENFDSYQPGDPVAQTLSDWNTWGELMNGTTAPFADDANIYNSLSYSGSNSLYLFSGDSQGAQDVVLPFGTAAPYELGVFEFSSMFYVNIGTGAYFNFQAENIPGTTWSLDCKMDLGTLVLENTGNGTNYLITTYPEEVWFELKLVCDLTNNNWELF